MGSFKEYDSVTANHDPALEMNRQLNDIQRIINESSKMSEDALNKNKEQQNKGYIEFNKSFSKNLKAVENIFEDDKRKSHRANRTINSTINLSSIEEHKNASIQKPFFSNHAATPTSNRNRS